MEGKIAAAVILLSIWTLVSVSNDGIATAEQVVHTKTFLSPVYELGPGEVTETYRIIDMPTGHIGVRSFYAEVVDENDVPVPLTEVYIHHWTVYNVKVNVGYKQLLSPAPKPIPDTDFKGHFHSSMRPLERMAFHPLAEPEQVKREGTCFDDSADIPFFALGAESRHTNATFPAPYAIVTGDPATIPAGKEDVWYLNFHGIATKDVADIKSCFECLCEAYGVTHDADGRPLSEGYVGGLYCCYDKAQCAVKENADLSKRKIFFKYTVTWVDWDTSVIPLRSYGIDVTDGRTSLSQASDCKNEYTVEQCNKVVDAECVDLHHTVAALPIGGDIIYARLHQHTGSLGGIIYDNDGVVICASHPIYGQGTAAGDEAGFLVGVTTCFPEVGTMYVDSWKELHMDAYYSTEERRTGVMAIFALRVADPVSYISEVTDKPTKM